MRRRTLLSSGGGGSASSACATAAPPARPSSAASAACQPRCAAACGGAWSAPAAAAAAAAPGGAAATAPLVCSAAPMAAGAGQKPRKRLARPPAPCRSMVGPGLGRGVGGAARAGRRAIGAPGPPGCGPTIRRCGADTQAPAGDQLASWPAWRKMVHRGPCSPLAFPSRAPHCIFWSPRPPDWRPRGHVRGGGRRRGGRRGAGGPGPAERGAGHPGGEGQRGARRPARLAPPPASGLWPTRGSS